MGKDVSTGQRYAVKAFAKDYLSKKMEKNRASLKKEIDILRDMDHPNLIKLYEVHETDNSIYLVMELLRGGEISNLSKPRKISKSGVRKIMRSCLVVLKYLKGKRLMHRDLKPSNIIFKYKDKEVEDNEIKFVDFGLSDYSDSDFFVHKKCGTPGFIAPEVLNSPSGEVEYDCSCDIFSVGMIFHFLLCHKTAYSGENLAEIYKKNKEMTINFEDELLVKNTNITEMDLLKKMLELEPSIRISPESALEHPFFTQQNQSDLNPSSVIKEEELQEMAPMEENELLRKLLSHKSNFRRKRDLDANPRAQGMTIDQSLVYNLRPLINGNIETYVSSNMSSGNSCRIVSLQTARDSTRKSSKNIRRPRGSSMYKIALTNSKREDGDELSYLYI